MERAPSESPGRRALGYALTYLITAVFLALLVRALGGVGELARASAELRWPFFGIAVGLSLLNVALSGLRLQILMGALTTVLRYRDAVTAVLAAWPLSVITPSRAGDLYRAYHLREAVPLARGVGVTLVEKVVDGHALLLLVAGVAVWSGAWGFAALAAVGVVAVWVGWAWIARRQTAEGGGGAAGWAGALGPRLSRLRPAVEAAQTLSRRPLRLLSASLVALGALFVSALLVFFLLRFASVDVELSRVVQSWPLAVCAGLLPLTLAGLGTRDAAFVYLLTSRHPGAYSESSVLIATLTYALVGAWLVALLGLPVFLWSRRRPSGLPTAQSGFRHPASPSDV